MMLLLILLTSCVTTRQENNYTFPTLDEDKRIDDGLNITSYDKDGNVIYYYNGINDTVTIPFWYWIKLINYGINTGGISLE